MNFTVTGINHHTAPAEIRGRIAFTDKQKADFCHILLNNGCDEAVVLSTCNRSEVYTFSYDNGLDLPEIVKTNLINFFNANDIESHIFTLSAKDTAKHIFRVASGLDSILLFEDQILGQVRDAYAFAMEQKTSGKILNRLFRDAITCAKAIKTSNMGVSNSSSLAAVGLDFLNSVCGGFNGKSLMLVGLGKIGQLALKHAQSLPFKEIYAVNRSKRRFYELFSENEKIIPVDFEERYNLLSKTDVVITATASPHTVFTAEKMPHSREPIYILDLAIPADVEKSVGTLDGIRLYNVDSLGDAAQQFHKDTARLVSTAEQEIAVKTLKFIKWYKATTGDEET